MKRIIALLMSLIGYFCVATVITLALIVGYLWHTDHLNQQKAFRIVALLQDIDLEQLAEAQHKTGDDVPPEEPSMDDMLRHQQIQDRNFEVKQLALQRGRQEYDHRLQLLKEQTDRYDRLATEWQSRWKKEAELTTQENLAKVVAQIEQLRADNGKAMLLRWIDEGRTDDAILLMSKMSENKLGRILKTFETEEELNKLHDIHQRIISSGSANSQLEKALGEMKAAEPTT
ncbi:MAG TPA: hypothetical protein VJ828_18595 [Lacipirellulaceae bacterium]|nr:hypothetical protein [Lacipirellulaceae bacterium]